MDQLDMFEEEEKELPLKEPSLKKYPLVCPACGTVATREFKDEPCSVCGGQWEERKERRQ